MSWLYSGLYSTDLKHNYFSHPISTFLIFPWKYTPSVPVPSKYLSNNTVLIPDRHPLFRGCILCLRLQQCVQDLRMRGWVIKHEKRAKKDQMYADTSSVFSLFLFPFYWLTLFIRPSFPPSLSFITLRQLGQKSQAFGSIGDSAIQHPVCHNTGTTKCGPCQLMAVYPP